MTFLAKTLSVTFAVAMTSCGSFEQGSEEQEFGGSTKITIPTTKTLIRPDHSDMDTWEYEEVKVIDNGWTRNFRGGKKYSGLSGGRKPPHGPDTWCRVFFLTRGNSIPFSIGQGSYDVRFQPLRLRSRGGRYSTSGTVYQVAALTKNGKTLYLGSSNIECLQDELSILQKAE